MPRKGPAPKRPVVVDPVYGSPIVTQLVSKILQDGKKQVAQRIVYTALEGCREKTGTDPVVTLKRALDNVRPALEVRSRRVGGATYQVPVEVRASRQTTLALRWLVQQGNIAPIPRSSNPQRIAENIQVFDFELTPAELDRISALKRPHGRIANPVERVGAWD